MSKFNRWLRSKAGMGTVAGVIIILLLVVVVGQQAGWWDSIASSGAAGVTISLPQANYPDPKDGATCLPTCNDKDGKFLFIANSGMSTFSGEKVVVWIGVPGNRSNFTLDIFDGDSGRSADNSQLKWQLGNWDGTTQESVYTLYADPLKDNTGTQVVATWKGNADNMPNNAWFSQTVSNVPAAQAPSRHYFYRLEVTQNLSTSGGNAFKLRSNGYLAAGRTDLVKSSIGFMGQMATAADRSIIYPNFVSSSNLGQSPYNGDWQFYIYVPQDSTSLTIWDGDFDRGTDTSETLGDDDDKNTEGKPEWSGPFTKAEGRGGEGSPQDDNPNTMKTRSPEVKYKLLDPGGQPTYINENPSGTEEWERFVLSTDPAATDADQVVSKIQPGFYVLEIEGLDVHNVVFLRTDKEVCDPVSGCGPCVWPGCNAGACPRTIGYWKNNVRKVYIQNSNRGVQESKETLDWALKAIAMKSPIYRAGLVDWIKANPKATTIPQINANPVPLSPTEADAVLQKTTAFGNSMLGRALQQNLATWLNLGSGKISDNAVVVIDVPSGKYSGTMIGALLEAQNIMMNGGNIERAKDIADMINNGQINTDPASNVDGSGNAICTLYTTVAPPEKQPKKYDELPKAPKPQDPGDYNPGTPPDPNTCEATSNNYQVENPTFNPFYSIKFEYKSGTEVKDGGVDQFKYVLTKEQAASITSMQLEAKAGEDVGIVTMECNFGEDLACEPVMSSNMLFAFTFLGATDNGDGTVTLTFEVQNYSSSGLSHASFGLPQGVIPSGPSNNGSYDSKVCK